MKNNCAEVNNWGKVFLVGAGPGDPKLLTIRALEVLREADVILYDRLVNPEILAFASGTVRKVSVGKTPRGGYAQSQINKLMISEAKSGKKVVRLKGGDPMFFARGGEEALALKSEGIEFEIVPGISSVMGAGDYAGIPLTFRGVSSSVTIVTGHEASSKGGVPAVDWKKVASSAETLVIVMGVERLSSIARGIIGQGSFSENTPIAVVERATTEAQRVTLFTLEAATSKEEVARLHFESPAVIIVGPVAVLAREISWKEDTLGLREVLLTSKSVEREKSK